MLARSPVRSRPLLAAAPTRGSKKNANELQPAGLRKNPGAMPVVIDGASTRRFGSLIDVGIDAAATAWHPSNVIENVDKTSRRRFGRSVSLGVAISLRLIG
ncbi:hypothetical protein [Bradyrhizobium genosp. P]|uniref:hypothetical protein n=1 Tax=Bradyrhizobium genosp. P TaxID=83641 RepID=UPI003CEE069F